MFQNGADILKTVTRVVNQPTNYPTSSASNLCII
jgi:hypothetical protein